MRYTSLSSLLIPVYLVVIVLSKFFDCQDICKNPELETYENVISENGSYKYSHHYHYSRTIRHNQKYPVVSDSFKKFSTTQNVTPKFSFKYYGINVTRFEIFLDGKIKIFGEENIGTIYNFVYGESFPEYEMVETMISLLSNGIMRYWLTVQIPTEQKATKLTSIIEGVIQCGDVRVPIIRTVGKWITSDTLVELKPIESMLNLI
ncbi:unnamed protein product [Schistosoma mattheei]|uniref:Uncharacterized protein n=1 Tax=Schistosoma mattheei TaxID=31246 RepID=A0AA85AT02_9TREM|nr:unnamed protein product [Schistosoma mattheei]